MAHWMLSGCCFVWVGNKNANFILVCSSHFGHSMVCECCVAAAAAAANIRQHRKRFVIVSGTLNPGESKATKALFLKDWIYIFCCHHISPHTIVLSIDKATNKTKRQTSLLIIRLCNAHPYTPRKRWLFPWPTERLSMCVCASAFRWNNKLDKLQHNTIPTRDRATKMMQRAWNAFRK